MDDSYNDIPDSDPDSDSTDHPLDSFHEIVGRIKDAKSIENKNEPIPKAEISCFPRKGNRPAMKY